MQFIILELSELGFQTVRNIWVHFLACLSLRCNSQITRDMFSCELCRLQQNRKRLLSIHSRREKPCYETSRHKTWKNALGARA